MKRIFVMVVQNGRYVHVDDLDAADFLQHEKKYQEQYLEDFGQVIFIEAESDAEAEEIANQ